MPCFCENKSKKEIFSGGLMALTAGTVDTRGNVFLYPQKIQAIFQKHEREEK